MRFGGFRSLSTGNNFTKLLEDYDTPLETILGHEGFASAVRNSSKQLIQYFFPDSEMEEHAPNIVHFDDLIDYALSLKFTDPKYKIMQLNRNAANLLAYHSTKFMKLAVQDPCKRLSLRLREFINDKECNQNTILAGHYQRICENYLRCEPDEFTVDYDDGFTLQKFIDFLIENVHILPYRELLSDVMSEFNEIFGDKIADLILEKAAKIVFFISDFLGNTFSHSHQFSFNSALKTNNYTLESLDKIQPINVNKEKIPLPEFLIHPLDNDEPMPPVILDQEFLHKQQDFVKFDEKLKSNFENVDQIINCIYCMLSTIRLAAVGVTEIYKNLQNENSIHLLLIIGVFCDSSSVISIEAFYMLRCILYGYDDIPKMDAIPKIIDEFAENFTFEPDAMTTQMFSAFPIFWNFRYLTTATSKDDYKVIDPSKFDKETQKEYPLNLFKTPYKKPQGKTPLEFLTPLFFSEPPLNTTFNVRFMEILERLNNDRQELFGDKTDVNELSPQVQKKVLEIDLIYFEFLRNKFDYNNTLKNVTVNDILAVVTPLVTTDEFFHPNSKTTSDEEQHKMHRVPLNGHILKILQFIRKTKLLEPSEEDQGIFYDFIPESNKLTTKYYQAVQKYEELMTAAEKNAVILETNTPMIVDEIELHEKGE